MFNNQSKVTDAGCQGLMTTLQSPLEHLYVTYTFLTRKTIVITNKNNKSVENLCTCEMNIPETTWQ